MANISQNDYYYYLHKTNVSSPEKIESIFNEGLKSNYDYSIHSTLMPIDEETLKNIGLEQIVINYLGSSEDYNCVFVVKIPKRYMSCVMHRDGNVDPTMPLWRSLEGYDPMFSTLFTPKLIQGVYCRDINKSFTNPNFNPVFDPSGSQVSDEQLSALASFNLYHLVASLKERRKIPFHILYSDDRNSNRWKPIIDYYSKLYGVIPTPMITYQMPEEDKELFRRKHL